MHSLHRRHQTPAHPQAIEREDYDEAKRLKGAVDRLRAVGGAIAGLEARKRAAVEVRAAARVLALLGAGAALLLAGQLQGERAAALHC